MSKYRKSSAWQIIGAIIIAVVFAVMYFWGDDIQQYIDSVIGKYTLVNAESMPSYNIGEIPEYDGTPYVIINNNIPNFAEEDYTTQSFEKYTKLDVLGRCGIAYANVCREIMPPEGDIRGDISLVHPSGWRQKMYNEEFLYNRCHLIGYQLSDEDANELNLITGTRYFNVEGMLPFENQVADYIKYQKKSENKHVLYRVTPIFEGNNLVASGVQIEAYSVEDNGQGVCFNVYVYNVQPGITIDYLTGDSKLAE